MRRRAIGDKRRAEIAHYLTLHYITRRADVRPGKRRTETDSSGTAGNDRVEKLDGHVTQLPLGFPGTRDSTRQQAQFTKYLTIYRKIIVSLS